MSLCYHLISLLVSVHLRHVGDLGGGPVPGVHQHRVVGLLPPARLAPVHLRQPVGGGPGPLVPAYDDAPVSPPAGHHISLFAVRPRIELPLVFYDLTNPVLHMRRSHVSGLWTLTEVTVLVPEPEHLHGGALPHGVGEGVQQVLQSGAHQPVAPPPPGGRTQPVVTKLGDLINHLGDRVGPVITQDFKISSHKDIIGFHPPPV